MRLAILTAVVALGSALPASAEVVERRRSDLVASRIAARLTAPAPLHDAIRREATMASVRTVRATTTKQPRGPSFNWVGRHPVCFGSLVGFIAGFWIGYLPGDDGVFYDFDASFNGLVIGGVGAGVGAIVGRVLSR